VVLFVEVFRIITYVGFLWVMIPNNQVIF